MAKKSTNLLANLPQELTITNTLQHEHSIEIFVNVPKPKTVACPHCLSTDCISKGSDGYQTLRHTPSGNYGTLVTFKKLRFYCHNCHSSFTWHPQWQHSRFRITNALWLKIYADLHELLSLPQIAKDNHVTVNVVRSVLESVCFSDKPRLPKTFCIDEFKGDSGVYNKASKKWNRQKLQCCVANGDSGRIIEIFQDRTLNSLEKYFRKYSTLERSTVQYFCCDMYDGYVSFQKKMFPKAILCVDRFHVIKRLNLCLTEIRRRLQNEHKYDANPISYKLLKDSRYILLTKEENRTKSWGAKNYPVKLEKLQEILNTFPDLCEAFNSVQHFYKIYESDAPVAILSAELSGWIDDALSSYVPELRQAACTIKKWKLYILNSIQYGKSNGPCEGLNNRIKILKRISFGVHDFENFRKRILLTCGRERFPYDEYTVFNEKRRS